MGRLEGKIAIVTGGARGMGASHVRRFVAEGARVMFTDLLEDEGRALAAELPGVTAFLRHDVTVGAEWDVVARKTAETFGAPHILVNNAGIVLRGPIESFSEADYRKVVDAQRAATRGRATAELEQDEDMAGNDAPSAYEGLLGDAQGVLASKGGRRFAEGCRGPRRGAGAERRC